MAKRKIDTDEAVLSCSNVPVPLAAQYLGCSPETLRESLRQGRAPFGYGIKSGETGKWAFHISPGLLIAYQNGSLQPLNTGRLVEQIAADVGKVLEARYKNAVKMLCAEILGEST